MDYFYKYCRFTKIMPENFPVVLLHRDEPSPRGKKQCGPEKNVLDMRIITTFVSSIIRPRNEEVYLY